MWLNDDKKDDYFWIIFVLTYRTNLLFTTVTTFLNIVLYSIVWIERYKVSSWDIIVIVYATTTMVNGYYKWFYTCIYLFLQNKNSVIHLIIKRRISPTIFFYWELLLKLWPYYIVYRNYNMVVFFIFLIVIENKELLYRDLRNIINHLLLWNRNNIMVIQRKKWLLK